MEQENVVLRSWIRFQARSALRHIRHSKNPQVVLINGNPAWSAFNHLDPERTEQPEDATGLRSARSVMVAGDHHNRCMRQHLHEPRELKEGVQYRRVGRSDSMKDVASDQHQIGLQLDHDVDDATQRARDIRLTLVDPGGCLSLVLSEAEVYVREVNQSHRVRIARIHWVIFVRTCIGAPCAAPTPFRAGSPIVDLTMMLLLESVIQPSLRSIWIVPDSTPEVA